MESWNEKFYSAAKSGNIEVLTICLQNAVDINYEDGTGWTALMRAALGGHLEVTGLLLGSGCKTDMKNWFGWTAFMIAAMQGNLEITRLIHDSGCTTDINDKNGLTALHLAAEYNRLHVAKYLVERTCISPLSKTREGKTPYDLAAARHDYPRNKNILEYLKSAMSKYAQDVKTKTSKNIQETALNEDNIPNEIKSMTDNKSVALYLKLLESGSEKKRDIRLVFVGEKGAGKTSLMNRLFDKDITDTTSTNGIEIHTVNCRANSDDGLWIKLQENNEETEIHGRLLKPYKESIQDKETAESVHAVAAGTYSPGVTASEEKALRISPSNVRPLGITTSNENQEGTIEQSQESLDQAKMDIETMLTDRSKVDFQDKEEYATLLLWDFAGDEEFYHTHQTFLSSEAIYLVVAKLDDAHDEKAQEMFQLWMNSIHCYCKLEEQKNTPEINNTEREKDKNGSLEPRVVLVGSHKDKVEPSERKKIDEACSDRIDSYVNTISEVAQHHIHDEYFISNTVMSVNDDNVFQKIRQAILVLARKMRSWNIDYPLKFIQLEKLLHVKKKELPIISLEKIKQISLETPLPLNKEELELFLKYHHEIRALVYFEDLPNYIVLDTQWLADAFKCIVTADKFRSGKGRHLGSKAWDDLNKKGILYCQLLKFIIETNKNIFKFEREQNNYILNVMEKFDIIIRPNNSMKDTIEDTPQYYVPCMVKSKPDLINIYEMFKVEKNNKSTWLCFEFKFLPPHLINHLIASLSREYEIAECFESDKKKIALFKGIAVFECKQEPSKLQQILVMTDLNLIQIQVWEFAKSAKKEQGMYKHIADFMTAEINTIIGTRFKMSNVTFEQKWSCGISSTKPECAILMNNFSKEPMTEYRCRRCNENHTFIDEWSEQQNKTPGSVMSKDVQDINSESSGNIQETSKLEVPPTSNKLHLLSTPETNSEKILSDFERKIYQSFRDKTYEVCKFLLENDVNEDGYDVLSEILIKAYETKDNTIQDLVFSRIVQEAPKIVKQFCIQYADIVKDANVWMAVECTCDKAIQIQHESVPCRKADLIFVIEKLVTSDYNFPKQFLGFQTLFIDAHSSNVNEAAKVAEEMMKYQEKVPMKVPGTLAKKMFKQHSNLTMVCSSVFKSKGFMTGSNELQDLNCVQLFCKKKGLIPIGECHFPLLVDGIPTDVLEGTSKFLSAVNVGDKISCNEKHTGTLGGFVKYYGVDTFLTCSHVIFGKTDFLDLQSKDLHFESRHISIHNELEPVECVLIRHSLKYDTSEKPMDIAGETNTFSVLQDNPEETSIDAALILIQTPKNSNSSVLRNVLTRKITGASAASSGPNTPIVEQIIQLQGVDPIYLNKNVLDPEHTAGPAFALAGFSKKQESNVTLKREEEVIIPITAHVNMRDNIILYNQFILQNMSFNEGDSGTCIYGRCKKSGQTGCIGMLIGASTSGQYIVTPMKDILNALGVANMH